MKLKRSTRQLLSTSVVLTYLFTSSAQASLAQSSLAQTLAQAPQPASPYVQPSSVPQQAPSFLRQAEQKLLDSAQKRILNNVDQRLQSQSQTPSNGSAQYGSAQAGSAQYGSAQAGSAQYGSAQGGSAQYGSAQNGSVQYGSTPNGSPQYGSMQNGSFPATTGSAGADQPARFQSAPCRSWVTPGEKPIACILCIHGLGLQSNSYEFFGKEQSKHGIAVYAIDVRGFGSWMNAKGKTKVNFDDCLEDIRQALVSIHAANPGLPVYLLGESMGGAIALRAASLSPALVDGLISSVPASERFNQGKTSMKVFLNLVTGLNIANVGNDLVNQATKNDKLKAQWEDDPLSRLNLSPQELIQFQDFMNFNHEAAKKVADMPVLFVQGIGDQLVKPDGTWELFNDVAAKDKSFFAVPGEHLIFEEAQTQDAGPRDQNFRVISSWLTTKVGRRYGHRGPITGMSGMNGPSGTNGPIGPSGSTPATASGARRGMSFINTQGLEGPAQMIDTAQYANAITALEQIRTQRPTDPNVLALLGKAYLQGGAPEKAGPLFREAMRIRRGGGDQAQAFNSYLLSMGGSQNATPNGSSIGQATSTNQSGAAGNFANPYDRLNSLFRVASNAAAPIAVGGKAKVYAFYANWAEQCKAMNDEMAQLSSAYGDRVEITRVNIEDSANDRLADQFKIGPIPTVVFVAPSGQVGSTIIGESTYNNYAQALNSIIR
jgi:acylglycerol lipase